MPAIKSAKKFIYKGIFFLYLGSEFSWGIRNNNMLCIKDNEKNINSIIKWL